MANKDGTGPEGKGPRTGRGLGNCNVNKHIQKKKNSISGISFKHGVGRGIGRGKGINR